MKDWKSGGNLSVWVLFPCEVGDSLYVILNGKVEKRVVSEFKVRKGMSLLIYLENTHCYYKDSDIGRSLFLSEEEALKALEERNRL